MITVIGWERYNLWIKRFADMNAVKKHVEENPNKTIVAVSGRIRYKSYGVSIR